ncbi:hypothetical protein EYF80_049128 [Liparis tanakae]|uniref:Uncharacterized protein n=1 Tax=Liparis tanakae TaxID=230148 RepID=A0A4Z2FID8_9TELE|nr:hypothetical protein EYF80_049128 [Liparis tanakae]
MDQEVAMSHCASGMEASIQQLRRNIRQGAAPLLTTSASWETRSDSVVIPLFPLTDSLLVSSQFNPEPRRLQRDFISLFPSCGKEAMKLWRGKRRVVAAEDAASVSTKPPPPPPPVNGESASHSDGEVDSEGLLLRSVTSPSSPSSPPHRRGGRGEACRSGLPLERATGSGGNKSA